MFKRTLRFYTIEASVFILFYIVPLWISIYNEERWIVLTCSISCLLTSIVHFIHEAIVVIHDYVAYFDDIWSIDKMTMILIYWLYFVIRTLGDGFEGCFLIIKNFEQEDSH